MEMENHLKKNELYAYLRKWINELYTRDGYTGIYIHTNGKMNYTFT